jgi:hypothetical protein
MYNYNNKLEKSNDDFDFESFVNSDLLFKKIYFFIKFTKIPYK